MRRKLPVERAEASSWSQSSIWGRRRWPIGLLTQNELTEREPTFPLELVFCPIARLWQITETVPPEVLFRDYVYFSSFSETMVAPRSEVRSH